MVILGKESEKEQITQALRELWELISEEQRTLLLKYTTLEKFKKMNLSIMRTIYQSIFSAWQKEK